MAVATRKRSKTSTLSRQVIDQADDFLQSLPEKPRQNWSLREAVEHLRDQISEALAKGYSYEDVAEMLSGQGIEISPSTLKKYISIGRSQPMRKRSTAGTKSKGTRSRRGDKDAAVTAPGSTPSDNGAAPNEASSGVADQVTSEDEDQVAATQSTERGSAESDAPEKPVRRRGRPPSSSKKADSSSKTTGRSTQQTSRKRSRRVS
jgi:hypothetical protein